MEPTSPKKAGPKNKTQRQRVAIKVLIEKRGSVGSAMREAGYAENTIKNPKNLTNSKAFKELLNDAGLNDTALAEGQRVMAEAAKFAELVFPNIRKTKLVEIDEEDPAWDEAGRKKQYRAEEDSTPIADKVIKGIVESIPGCKLLYIRVDGGIKVAVYSAPDHIARNAAYERAMKAKGHYAPESHNILFPTMSEMEKDEVDDVLGSL